MFKKTLLLMLFVMCISTTPGAKAEPCYCGGPVDVIAYEVCTAALIVDRDNCTNNLQTCHEDAVTEWVGCRAANPNGLHACNVGIGEAYKICDSYLKPCMAYGWSTWWECTDNACI
jgi:hypothetical protein